MIDHKLPIITYTIYKLCQFLNRKFFLLYELMTGQWVSNGHNHGASTVPGHVIEVLQIHP